MFRTVGLLIACLLCASSYGQSNSLDYLNAYCQPYYPGCDFPKLTTPQWIGEQGVDAVVTLAIDDMRDTAKYEAYLRPILDRLKKIDGRAPVSIMTCSVDPQDPQLQSWIAEGLTIEVHTVDHPCPCLQGGDFAKARSTYDRCVDLMASIPGNKPVAFRMPCCDSQNTPSPRFWVEAFNKRTETGNFLQADSSVFNVFTAADGELPRELVTESDGSSRFKKYIPFPSFVNTIKNYPYPYVIGKQCWQFPCMVPSDWEAQNIQRPNNPKTVDDMKAALDATVMKRGMFNMVFHPHGWIRNDQMVEFIDYAQEKYGNRVKFLNFKECVDRINHNLLLDQPIRDSNTGADNGVRMVDLDQDGFLDVMIGNTQRKTARVWQTDSQSWRDIESSVQFVDNRSDLGVHFGSLAADAKVCLFVNNEHDQAIYQFRDGELSRGGVGLRDSVTSIGGVDQGVRLRDLDRDGVSEMLVGNSEIKQIFYVSRSVPLPFAIVDEQGRDNGVRFVDFDSDGFDDIILANASETAVRLFDQKTGGFTRVVGDLDDVPLIVRDGTNNGVWFAENHMWVQNEDTNRLPDGVDRRSFEQLLGKTEPGPRSADLSLNSIKVRPGFSVELVAAEPLVMDPIAIDWGADGKLWVVEMADYPLGLDDQGKPGGRVRYLEDTDDDGKYDKSTLFLDAIAYPTGVIAWRDGVIVSAAPSVFFAADRDGDGTAEVREELYRGFGEGNQQHRVNGFERGLDNWLYLANGDSDGTIESVKTGQTVDISGRDLRIRPEDGSIEAVAGRTQFGRHRDDAGNWFGCSNPLPVRHYVLDDHYLRRNPHVKFPSAKRDIARVDNTQLFPISRVLSHWSGYKPPATGSGHQFTSACSTIVYRDSLFGDDFRMNTFTCEPVHNAVHRRRLVPEGVTFESVRPESETDIEFLASTDSWFRPTMVTTGPDGALWITDMYRLVIEHPEWIDDQREQELFLRAGHDRGRIYRVHPSGTKPRPILKLSDLSADQLIDQLASPSGRVRDLAQHLLIEQRDADTWRQLEEVVRSSSNPLQRLHALCALDGLDLSPATLLAALADEDATVRRHAIRIAELGFGQDAQTVEDIFKSLEACDLSDPHVRLQMAYSLGEAKSPRAARLLASIANESNDPFVRAAVISSLDARNLSEFHGALRGVAKQRYQAPMLQMATRTSDTEFLGQLVGDLLNAFAVDSPNPDELDRIRDVLEATRKQQVKLDQAVSSRIDRVVEAAMRLLSDPQATMDQRIAAIRLVAASGETVGLLHLVSFEQPIEIQLAAAEQIAHVEAEGLLARFPTLSPAVRTVILNGLLSRESTALALIDALKEQRVAGQAIGLSHRQKLATHVSQKVVAAAAELFDHPSLIDDKHQLVKQYAGASASAGDAILGQQVFVKQCSQCHRVKEIGHVVGPDLMAIKNRSDQAMLTAILDPNAAVEDKFRVYNALTIDGTAVTGIISDESSTSIQLKLQDGKSKSILRSDLQLIQSTGKSLMPEGMEKNIPLTDMSHLLAYLAEQGPGPKEFSGNRPATVRPNENGILDLSASCGRIYGDQIRFEEKYQNVGFWGQVDDRVQWTLETDHAGPYEVWIDYACPDGTAGNTWVFTCGDQRLSGKVASTGTWDDYRQVKLGEMVLPKSTIVAGLSADATLQKWLLDLRGIQLRPK